MLLIYNIGGFNSLTNAKSRQTFAGGAVQRSISGAPPPRSFRTLIRTCTGKNLFFFRNRYQPDMHYIVVFVPINSTILSWAVLKHRKSNLERHLNKISDSDQQSFAVKLVDRVAVSRGNGMLMLCWNGTGWLTGSG